MAKKKASSKAASTTAANIGFEAKLWLVLANPPFNDSDWFRKEDDVRWQYEVPPKGNPDLVDCMVARRIFGNN